MSTQKLYFFPRGDGPLVSVIFATRGRPNHLMQALDSLLSLAVDTSQIEIILKLDDDDTATLQAVAGLCGRHPHLKIDPVVTPRGRGFPEMGGWINLLADRAKGDWILIFNDDARMRVQDWDRKLSELYIANCWHICPEDVMMFSLETNGNIHSNEFALFRRKTYELMARKYPTPYVDSWMYYVCDMVKSHERMSILKIEHLREELKDAEDKTRMEVDGSYAEFISSLISTTPILGMMSDGMRLLNHIELKLASAHWKSRPIEIGWYFWRGNPTTQSGVHVAVLPNGDVRFPSGKTGRAVEVGGIWHPRNIVQGSKIAGI